jgi:hypothetical protein
MESNKRDKVRKRWGERRGKEEGRRSGREQILQIGESLEERGRGKGKEEGRGSRSEGSKLNRTRWEVGGRRREKGRWKKGWKESKKKVFLTG